MKKSLKMATLLVAGVAMLCACNNGDMAGFKTTDDGLHYRFEKQNPDGVQVQEGDVLVGEMTIRFDSIEIANTNGKPARLMQATQSFGGYLYKGLLMMHTGDVVTFAVEADSMAKYVQPSQMPPTYEPGKGMKFYYEINLQDIVTKDEIAQESANFEEAMRQRQIAEPDDIAEFIQENHITAKPTSEGLYVIVKKRGNGPKVAIGKEVSVNYTGRLLDGTIFDTNVEGDARTGNIYNPNRNYAPMTYVAGRDRMVEGWEQGVMDQPQGTVLQLIIPSALAYGERGARTILPYSPLVFDIEIVSVK